VNGIGGYCSNNHNRFCTSGGGQCTGVDGTCSVGIMNGFDRITCFTANVSKVCSGGGSTINNLLPPNTPPTCTKDLDCASYGATCVPAVDGSAFFYLDDGMDGVENLEDGIPYYWMLANRYGLADRFFSSEAGASYPNHKYIVAGDDDENA